MDPLVRDIIRQTFTSWEALADYLELNETQRASIKTKSKFPLYLPLRLAKKIQKSTLDDPILKQFLPTVDEDVFAEGFVDDPVGDELSRRSHKLIHKYHGRVLLVVTSACALHCRYCFRKEFDYQCFEKSFDAEINMIKEDPSIREVILSGGDPLSLNDERLGDLLKALGAIPHVSRIRFHSRFPIPIPERITDALLGSLSALKQSIWFVLHINHPSELDEDVFAGLDKLKKIGVHLLNQSVLLKGVNDDADTLIALSEKLVDHGIFPYYLHQLDRVKGTVHFEVEEHKGLQLIEEMAARLPGYAVPKYVKEEAGQPNKTMIEKP